MAEHVTLLRPGSPGPEARGTPSALPADLLGQAARRLRVVALLYAFTFFMAAVFPMLIVPADRAMLFGNVVHWGPSFGAILLALLVAVVVGSDRLPLSLVMSIGLGFEIAGSYGIAASELAGISGPALQGRVFGLSWVAVWTMLFTIVVPTRPRTAVLAALASVSSVPVIIALLMVKGLVDFHPNPGQFFFWLVLPYLLVVGMAYVGARVVYGLGTEVGRARELGSYELEEKLGEGGMGEVWRARHRMLARPAAVKLIRPALMAGARPGAPEGAIRRFEREAQAIARLRSPHTVELFDFGVATDGTFYYVMELLDGLDAQQLVRAFGPVPPERAIHLLRQACHSLSEAESCGLVHRDVKPANVFLCRYGEEFDFVKLLDFGIVRAAREPAGAGAALSGENVVQGTPAFMAPEQAMGRPVDGRTDLYALGCVAFWLLTGEPVFREENPLGLLVDHARTPPEPPSARTDRAIPPALDALVLACLAKDPANRPQTARELSRRLAEVEGAEAWTQERAREWWDRCQPAGPGANSSTWADAPGPPSPRPIP